MAGQIDEFGFPDFTADFDGRMISSSGGRTGSVVLLNGQEITFPWKSQQEIAGSVPGLMRTVEVDEGPGSAHWQIFQTWGAELGGNSPGSISITTTYQDDDSDGGTDRAHPFVTISSGFLTGGDEGSILVRGGDIVGTIQMFGDVTLNDSLAVDAISNIGVDNLTITSTQSLVLDVTGDILVDADGLIDIDAVGTVTVEGSSVTLRRPAAAGSIAVQSSGAIAIAAASAQQMTLDTSGGGDMFLTAAGAGGAMVLDAVAGITIDGGSELTLTSSAGSLVWSTLFGAWTTHTPSVIQGGAITHSLVYSRYIKIGRLVIWAFNINIDGAGAAATFTLSLPWTAASASNRTSGIGHIFNGTNVTVPIALNTTSTVAFIVSGGFYATALTAADAVTGIVVYESAS